jgi:hypothetical protein
MTIVHYASIPGLDGYEAGDDGNIRQHDGHGVWHACKKYKSSYGYLVVTLIHPERGPVQYTVSGLILSAFVGPRPEGMQACHGNGIRTDNRLSNLRWATPKENERDKIVHGTKLLGVRNHQHRLSESDVARIKFMIANDVPLTDIAHAFGVSRTAIHWIKVGRQWNHVAAATSDRARCADPEADP